MSVYDHLEYKHLKAIVAIAEAWTITAAADKLHVVQSALSRQIKDLEEALKVQVFERDRSGSTLTPAGESLLQFARDSLKSREDIVKAVQAIQQAGIRPFLLGFTPFVEDHVIDTVTEAYKSLFPRGKIQPENGDTDELVQRLRSSELDAVLLTLPLVPDGYCIQKIMQRPLVVCMRKDDPLAQRERVAPQSLNARLAIFSDPRHHPTAHARLLEMLDEQGIKPQEAHPTFNIKHVQWLVKSNVCVALIREDERLHDDLTTRPIEGVSWTIDSAIVYRRDHDQFALPLLLRDLEKRFSFGEPYDQKKPPRRASESSKQQELSFGDGGIRSKKQARS
jgi:DNA-binding transcriptional LysR family regulator